MSILPDGRYIDDAPYDPNVDQTIAREIAVKVIKLLMTFLGIIATVIILLGGFKWMTANGNDEAITKAKSTMTQAIIGLVIVLSAYALWAFISSTLLSPGNPS
jgi:hypothetical protein